MRERKAFPGTLVPTPAGVGDCPAGCSSVCSTGLSPNPIHRRPLLGMTCRNGANMQRAKSSGTWLICMQNPFLEAVCQSPDHPSESICRSQSLYLFLSLSLPICLSLSLSLCFSVAPSFRSPCILAVACWHIRTLREFLCAQVCSLLGCGVSMHGCMFVRLAARVCLSQSSDFPRTGLGAVWNTLDVEAGFPNLTIATIPGAPQKSHSHRAIEPGPR